MPPSSFLHYRIERPLGAGGMGEVYLAHDKTLDRRVALKFLPEAQAGDVVLRERLIREARTLATLSHPNIAAVYALENEGGWSCLVMEYVEGQTLLERIRRSPLRVSEVITLGIELAEGLAHAHERSAVHRDVKPANILITPKGTTKLTDFGIAYIEGLPRLTKTGSVVGTIPYLSPEVARGERADARGDLFSLGLVLYEALTGVHPFQRDRIEGVVHAILHEAPEPPTARRSGIPLELERVILKCLEKDPSLRYQSAIEIATDLRRIERSKDTVLPISPPSRSRIGSWPVLGAVAALLAAGLIWGRAPLLGLLAPKANALTVMVLPLEVRGQSEGVDYLGRAFAEAIAVNLAQAPSLHVLPVPQAGEMGAGTLQHAQAALRANARSLLSGALQRENHEMTASLSLTDAVENRIRWGTQGATTGSLPMLAASLAREVAARLGAEGPRRYDSPYYMSGGDSLGTVAEFAEALGALRRQQPEAAVQATERLVAAFPTDVNARTLHAAAAAGAAYVKRGGPGERAALDASLRNLERVDPNTPWSEMIRAMFLDRDGKPTEAIERFNHVLARNDLTPAARSLVLGWRAWPLLKLKNNDAALADLEEAVRLDPTNDNSLSVLGVALQAVGRHAEAVERQRRAVALNPFHRFYHFRLARGLARLGRWEEAAPHLERECSEQPLGNCAATHAVQAMVLQRAGRPAEAAAAAKQVAEWKETPFADYALACYRLASGEPDEALRQLGKAAALGYEDLALANDPNLRGLIDRPDFRTLAAAMTQRVEGKPIDIMQ